MGNSTISKKAQYALLADNVYWDVRKGFEKTETGKDFSKSNWTPVPKDWKVIAEVSGSGVNGKKNRPEIESFSARVFKKGNEVVIAYGGSDSDEMKDVLKLDKNDWTNNIAMANGVKSVQAIEAAKLFHQIQHQYPSADITFTGHSLGGGLAGLMGLFFDKKAYVFDHAPFKQAA